MGKLVRSKDKILTGVCAGIAEHFDWNIQALRLIWVVLSIALYGAPIVFYLLLWILMPDSGREKETFEERMKKRLGK